MAAVEDDEGVLRERLRRYPAGRYPVQHATASFHLGCTLIGRDRTEEAVEALATARELFAGLPIEQAKAANMLGVARRAAGDLSGAASCFEAAAAAFAGGDHDDEGAAAAFNLGLVRAQQGDTDAALDAFERAGRQFERCGAAAAAIAAERERAGVLLAGARFEEAAEAAGRAAERSLDAGDQAGHGGAANTLGLAQLARGRFDDAVAAFRAAAASNPRTVRPRGYAMAKANLALAWAEAGEPARARMAARQARHAPEVDPPVAHQAERVLATTGTGGDAEDTLAVLAAVGPEGWEPLLREEVARWVDGGRPGLEVAGEVPTRAVLSSPDPGAAAAAWLGVLLEVPPAAMEALIDTALARTRALPEADQDRFRRAVIGAMGNFHVPQWLRLRDTFAARAASAGTGDWS